jgi:signal transduction histidine kinase
LRAPIQDHAGIMLNRRRRSWLWAVFAATLGVMLYGYDDVFDQSSLNDTVLHYIATTIEILILGPGMGLLGYYWSENLHLRDLAVSRERARAQQQRFLALGRIAASVAHEVRNPLHNIRLIMDEMKEEGGFPLHHPLCERVENNLERINRAVSLVYQLAKPTGLDLAHDGGCDIDDVVHEIYSQLERNSPGRIGLTKWLDDKVGRRLVNCPVGHLRIILDNLLRNGVSASDAGHQVQLRVESIPTGYAVVVTNVGILPEGIAEMMDEGASSTMVSGLGLGLFISHHLALQAGATLRLQQNGHLVEAFLELRKEASA